MKVLFDIVHPAHVHFYRHLIARLEREGHEVRVIAREKDVTLALLDSFGISYETHGRSGHRTMAGQAVELASRDLTLWRRGRRFRPDVVLTRNPAGVQAARPLRAVGIFDTDNGRSAGIHFWMARPFAHFITTPECIREDYGSKHRRFPGYKALAFLHPAHYTPDPGVREEVGLAADEPYVIVRLVAMDASHDRNQQGVDAALLRRVVDVLEPDHRVLLSGEGALPAEFDRYRVRVAPARMHDLMAGASLLVGDSGSMAAEAAVLGVPSIFYGSFAGRLDYLTDLEQRYGLARSYRPEQTAELLEAVDDLTSTPSVLKEWQAARERMLDDAVDVSAWYYDLVMEVAGR